jgi:hypothetical protein
VIEHTGDRAAVSAVVFFGLLHFAALDAASDLGDGELGLHQIAFGAFRAGPATRETPLGFQQQDAAVNAGARLVSHESGPSFVASWGEVGEVNLPLGEFDNPAIPVGGNADRPVDGLRDGGWRLAKMLGKGLLTTGGCVTPCFEFHADRLADTQFPVKRLRNYILLACGHE